MAAQIASVFLVSLVAIASAGPVTVTVYYESLCPDSVKFITTQLFPAYTSPLKKHFDVKLVPYGKSTSRHDGQEVEFTCHHGPNECYGNKVQACVLKHVPEQRDQMTLINCLMANALASKNGTYPLDKCLQSTRLDPSVTGGVSPCANTSESSQLLADLGIETDKLVPALTSVPTVVFNGNPNKNDQSLAQSNFKAALCGYIKGEDVQECHGVNGGALLSASLSAFLVVLLAWL